MHKSTIIITGAAGDIGSLTAQYLQKKGFQVVLLDQNVSKLAALSESLGNCSYHQVDVTDANTLADLIQSYADSLYGLVLAAGIEGPVGNIIETDDHDFKEVIDVNVSGVWFGLKYGVQALKPKGKGVIVALASTSGLLGVPGLAAYSASKHAVLGLVKSAAREMAQYGIRVNAVSPGPVQSDMMHRIDTTLLEQNPARFGGASDASKTIPMGRYARPQEVAQAIAFLCSDESEFCTGISLAVDGGLLCR